MVINVELYGISTCSHGGAGAHFTNQWLYCSNSNNLFMGDGSGRSII